jgi:multidrug efflux pump subunit AcrA (membrane-fusion protein)
MIDLKKNVPSLLLVGVLGAATILLLTGRLRFGGPAPAGGSEAEAAPAEEAERTHLVDGKVVLDEEGLELSGIKTAEVANGSVAVTLTANGEVHLAEDHWVRVTPEVPGVVFEVTAKSGADVGAGVSLAKIKSTELGEAKAGYVTAQEEAILASKNLERWNLGKKSEFEKAAGAEEVAGWLDLDQAIADHDSAVAEQALADQVLSRTKDLVAKELKTRSDLLLAEQEVSRAKIRLDAARRRLGVLGVVAKNDLSRAQLKVSAAETRLSSLGVSQDDRGLLTLSGIGSGSGIYEVRTPMAGVVLERNATIGESVDTKDAMFVVADLSVVWVTTALYEKDLATVAEGMAATVRVPAFPDVVFPARLARVSHTVDEKTRTVVLQVEVQNALPAGGTAKLPLRPGMFATVSIETGRESDVLVVPTEAVQRVGNDVVVFVEGSAAEPAKPEGGPASSEGGKGSPHPGEKAAKRVAFEPRVVVLGTRDDRRVRVVKGLAVGERVAVENAYLLKSELVKSQFAEEE